MNEWTNPLIYLIFVRLVVALCRVLKHDHEKVFKSLHSTLIATEEII